MMEEGRMADMLSWPTLDGDLTENSIPGKEPVVVRKDDRVIAGEEIKISGTIMKRNGIRGPVVRLADECDSVICKGCSETGPKIENCPDHVCGVCGKDTRWRCERASLLILRLQTE